MTFEGMNVTVESRHHVECFVPMGIFHEQLRSEARRVVNYKCFTRKRVKGAYKTFHKCNY